MLDRIKFWICENITGHKYEKFTGRYTICKKCGVIVNLNLTKRH